MHTDPPFLDFMYVKKLYVYMYHLCIIFRIAFYFEHSNMIKIHNRIILPGPDFQIHGIYKITELAYNNCGMHSNVEPL